MSKKERTRQVDLSMHELEEAYKAQKTAGYENRPIFLPKPPDKDTKFAYRLTIDGQFRKLTSRRQITWDVIDVKIIETVNDEDTKTGIASMLCHDVLKKSLEKFGAELKGQTFDVMNMGKPDGKRYYDFIVRKAEGTLRLFY
jgi:glycerol kinase